MRKAKYVTELERDREQKLEGRVIGFVPLKKKSALSAGWARLQAVSNDRL